jgi:hypothetical protein
VVSGLNDETNEQIVTFENVFERYSYSLLETFRVSLTSWWKSDISLFLNYSDPIKTKEDIDLRLYGGFEFYGSLNNSLILNDPKNIAGEVNYSYGSPYGGTVFQFSESHNLDLAVTFKSLFKGFNLTTGFYDVFNSSPRKMISEFNGIEQNYISRPSNRYFRISLAYNFGNEKISVKNRQFGNEDQRNRSN